jgi:hypothetical protein
MSVVLVGSFPVLRVTGTFSGSTTLNLSDMVAIKTLLFGNF